MTSVSSSNTTTLTTTTGKVSSSVPTPKDDYSQDFDILLYTIIGVASAVFFIIVVIVICFVGRSRRRARANIRHMEKARSRPVPSYLQHSDVTSADNPPVREVHSPLYDTDPEQLILCRQQPAFNETHLYENTDKTSNDMEQNRPTNPMSSFGDAVRKSLKEERKTKQNARRGSDDSYVDTDVVVEIKESTLRSSSCKRQPLVKQRHVEMNESDSSDSEDYKNSEAFKMGSCDAACSKTDDMRKHSEPIEDYENSEAFKVDSCDAARSKTDYRRKYSEPIEDYENSEAFKVDSCDAACSKTDYRRKYSKPIEDYENSEAFKVDSCDAACSKTDYRRKYSEPIRYLTIATEDYMSRTHAGPLSKFDRLHSYDGNNQCTPKVEKKTISDITTEVKIKEKSKSCDSVYSNDFHLCETLRVEHQSTDGAGQKMLAPSNPRISPTADLQPLICVGDKSKTHAKRHNKRKRNGADSRHRSKTTTAIPSFIVPSFRKSSAGNIFSQDKANLPMSPPTPCFPTKNTGYVNAPKKVPPAVAPKPMKKNDNEHIDIIGDALYLDMNAVPKRCGSSDDTESDADYVNAPELEDMYVQPSPCSNENCGQGYANVRSFNGKETDYLEPDEMFKFKIWEEAKSKMAQ